MKRVLVVDDSRTMRGVIRRSLTMCGLPDDQIVEATDGAEALSLMREARPHLVISDVNMPRMTGSSLLQAIKNDDSLSAIPVIIVTSVSSSRQLLELVRDGAARIIRKPFDPQTLPDALASFVAETHDTAPTLEADVPEIPVDRWTEVIDASVEALLERMAFAEAVPVGDAPMNRLLLHASIAFKGLGGGSIRVACPLDCARGLAETMLGGGELDRDVASVDVVAELANILAGDVLRRYAEGAGLPQEDFGFGLPTTSASLPGERVMQAPRVYSLDGGADRLLVEVAR